jgi:hypothetical protein
MIERVSFVCPVADLAASVERWSALLEAAPTFVDGDRWAQFDLGPVRVALAGSDRASDAAALMVKVDDLEAARKVAAAGGFAVGEAEQGPHEVRCLIGEPGGPEAVLYAARPAEAQA